MSDEMLKRHAALARGESYPPAPRQEAGTDDLMAKLQAKLREMEIGGGKPFASREEADEAAYRVMNCQDGDDDLMCLSCQKLTRRLLATARQGVEDTARLDWDEAHPNRVYIDVMGKWYIRDRDRNISAGPFDSKRAAIDAARTTGGEDGREV